MSRGEHTEILPYGLVETETLRIDTNTSDANGLPTAETAMDCAVSKRQVRTDTNPKTARGLMYNEKSPEFFQKTS